ncbi:SAM domain-containing protein SAMSN-1 isoform X1 [Microcaecilia unicolor]|uniref:SAM domain-containing protein SAMSN-1 n=2 Tax=Microcaecilia unicolor TaxID=1415580 RepID=A0A6P7YDU1_9AMPH|nr:SAM domain-containing protein SAMSN-1 isoform X1 [Microcaecilia unicolor]
MLKRKPSNISEKEKSQKPKRTSSFGTFDRFRHHSVSKPEDSTEFYEGENAADGEDQATIKSPNNSGSLGKKMKAISLTMKKKMGKKYIKALSEDRNKHDDGDANSHQDSDPGGGLYAEKVSLKASESTESLHSLNSGQSSSSGTSNRDSLKFDEDIPYTGPFCGRAKVHTDFIPSPYDLDSLKIKKGDVIEIICKTPMGTWTGMLNNKVGNFKFIYVDVMSDEEATPRKIKTHRRSKRPRPKTLEELVERLQLQEYTSTLLLNGYETLDDLKDLKESHLIELNISNPEDRARLLAAAENLHDCEVEQDHEDNPPSMTLSPDLGSNKSKLNECPRDSGCYISSENSDNGKDDLEIGSLCDAVERITVTDTN